MHVVSIDNPQDIKKIMQDINVDSYGINIMVPKATTRLLKIGNLPNINANIIKQEILSLGGDAAIARGALTGTTKKTDCLLMGSVSQFFDLCKKLRSQPFGLGKIAQEIEETLNNYKKENFVIKLNGYKLNLSRRTHIMGIVNLTTDSFSGDGLYASLLPAGRQGVVCLSSSVKDYVEKMIKEGADIVDVGGESSRPGAKPVSAKTELNRTIPVIKNLAKRIKVPISIDTYKPEVANAALDSGAVIVNDITGLRNVKMAKIISRYRAGIIIMHMKGRPQTMQKNPKYKSLIDEIIAYLKTSIKTAQDAGIARDKIIIDPGIGFGKTLEDNLEILKHLREFKSLGFPILVFTSRKSFIGKITGRSPQERIWGTVASYALAVTFGVSIIRVHDVREAKDSLRVIDAILRGHK